MKRLVVVALLAAASCGSPENVRAPPSPGPAPPPENLEKAATRPGPRPRPDAAAIFARLQPDLLRCYAEGLKSTPEMTSGKVTLNASVDDTGRTTCVIPSDGMGITQDVSDCMAARFTAEKFDEGAAWSPAVGVLLRAGAVELGERAPDVFEIESIETVRMPNAFERAESLLPQLETCVHGVDRSGGLHRVLVAARIGATGATECALATSAGVLPEPVATCAASVLRATKFPAPKKAPGLILIPINLLD